jgi:sortase A
VIMMALALALLIAAGALSVALRSEPERLVAAEVATNSPGQVQRSSSGQEGSATKNSSSHKESPRSSSGEQEEEKSLRYGSSSSSGGPLEQPKEETKEPQAQLQQEAQTPNSQSPLPQLAGQHTSREAPSGPQSQSQQHQPQQEEPPLPGAEQRGWQKPTQGELKSAKGERHYELLPGAIMGLTIEAMGINDAPVFDSDGRWALAKGIAHNPQTSLPWSPTPQRNVYLAGHRMGFRGTWSRMIFYNLDKLKQGDEVLLKERAGTSYRYRVSEVFVVDPTDSWVMGQVRGRDMVTLQTCIPYPTFEKRLIVRADRV